MVSCAPAISPQKKQQQQQLHRRIFEPTNSLCLMPYIYVCTYTYKCVRNMPQNMCLQVLDKSSLNERRPTDIMHKNNIIDEKPVIYWIQRKR